MAAASPKEQFEAAVNLIQSLPKNGSVYLHDSFFRITFNVVIYFTVQICSPFCVIV